MTIATQAVDAAIGALRMLNRPELYVVGSYTPAPSGPTIEVGLIIRRSNSESSAASLGQQREGARILIDIRDVPTRPIAGATIVFETETFRVMTAERGPRFWHCEATPL
jgi:hypothetical protein